MQTKTIFRPALALLLCGAAMLWGGAMGQSSETPTEPEPTLIAVPDWETVNSCIAADGDLDIRLNEGTADIPNDWIVSCTPADPNATPPEVAPPPGGVEVDEPAIPSPPEPARIAVSIFNPPGTPPDYSLKSACLKFGGVAEEIANAKEYVCSEIDINDTFCFGGSKEALPCKGLYDHVRRCNYYNRRTLDPFYCAQVCATGFACGDECLVAGVRPNQEQIDNLNLRESNRPFPEGQKKQKVLFAVEANTRGSARYELLQGGSALSISTDVPVFLERNIAPIVLVAPEQLPEAGLKYAATVRASFSCGGLDKKHGEILRPFEITATSDERTSAIGQSLEEWWNSLQ